MNIRVLRYFLAAVTQPNLTSAAEYMHTTQPNLSRQLLELEEELGQTLFDRSKRRLTLTPQGQFLFQKARNLVRLFDQTKEEVMNFEDISGKITFAAGESNQFSLVANAMKCLQQESPNVHYEIQNGDEKFVNEQLAAGLTDFGLFIGQANTGEYVTLTLPVADTWGLICRKDSEMGSKKSVSPEDIRRLPLLLSNQALSRNELTSWINSPFDRLKVVARFNLAYNAVLMTRAGLGCTLGLKHVGSYERFDDLVFIPLSPVHKSNLVLAWRKDRDLTLVAQRFLHHLKELSQPEKTS